MKKRGRPVGAKSKINKEPTKAVYVPISIYDIVLDFIKKLLAK